MTALTVFGTNTAATTATTDNTLVTSSGGANTSKNTTCGTATGYSELFAQGTAGAWSAAGALPAASDNGFLLDATTLEGQTIAAGNWTPTVRLKVSVGTLTADIWVRASVRSSGGSFTTIGTISLAGQSITTTTATYAFSAASLSSQAFGTGQKLAINTYLNITANSTGSGAATISLTVSNSSTLGVTTCQVVTPGYAATPGGTHFFICDGMGGVFS